MLAKRRKISGTILLVSLCILALIGSGCATTQEPAPEPAPAPVSEPEAAPSPAPAEPPPQVEVKPTAPKEYIVKKGDTLWDISSTFLKDPWYWPEIWHINQQIVNPHLIYPGDVIALYYIDGRPYLTVNGGPRVALSGERLSPKIREEALDPSLVPVQTVHPFLIHPRVVSKEVLETTPYIVDSQDQRLIYGAGDRVYVRNLEREIDASRYSVFRPGKELRDPKTGELLGYEAIHVGEADLIKQDKPSTMVLVNTVREALRGDRLLPAEENASQNYLPHPPDFDAEGTVVSLFDAITQIGQNQVAVLNLGDRDGMERGHVLAVYQAGRQVRDTFASNGEAEMLTLPAERIGIMMVFKTFDKVSYALVMESVRPIEVGDTVKRP